MVRRDRSDREGPVSPATISIGVRLIDQPLDNLGIVLLGPPIRDGDMAVPTKGLNADEQVGCTTPNVFVVGASRTTGPNRQRRRDVGMER